MRISDWSSDVCSSDLGALGTYPRRRRSKAVPDTFLARRGEPAYRVEPARRTIGREHADERMADQVLLRHRVAHPDLLHLHAAVGGAVALSSHQEDYATGARIGCGVLDRPFLVVESGEPPTYRPAALQC